MVFSGISFRFSSRHVYFMDDNKMKFFLIMVLTASATLASVAYFALMGANAMGAM